jgi:hypothetical protein
MTELKTQLEEIQKEFKQEESRTKEEFNIFNALYNNRDEKLHSRFISYLLSPESRHKMGNSYLKLFIERLSKTYPDLNKFNIDNCTVLPNEDHKTEHEKIDIFIQNHDRTQAIIIENKIYAGDSNYPDKTKPEERIQLIRYYDKVKSKENEIFVLYLTPDRHAPEEIEEIDKRFPVLKIDYPNEIIEWIDKCIEITDEIKTKIDSDYQLLIEMLEQYKSVIHSFTNNLKRAKKLKRLLDENIKDAWQIIKTRDFIFNMDDFKHVKWHTIDEFWRELAKKLRDELKVEISKEIDIKEITKVAHDKKGSTGINFKLDNGQEWYIVNDKINGLSYGEILPNELEREKKWFVISENINFIYFNNEETFKLINVDKRRKRIDEIINTLKSNSHLSGLKSNLNINLS